MSKTASKSVFTSAFVVSPDPLSPAPLTSSAMKIPQNTEKGPDNPEPADEVDIQMKYPLLSCVTVV